MKNFIQKPVKLGCAHWFAVCALLALGISARAQEAVPGTVVAPLSTFNISGGELSTFKKLQLFNQTDLLQVLAGLNVGTFLSLANWVDTSDLTLNQVRRSTSYVASNDSLINGEAVAIDPQWCSVGDRYVFIFRVMSLRDGEVLLSKHRSFPRQDLRKFKNPADIKKFLLNEWQLLAGEVRAASAGVAASIDDKDAMHVGLALTKSSTRQSEGAGHCLNQLLLEELINRRAHRMTSATGREHVEYVRQVLGGELARAKVTRATRMVGVEWQFARAAAFRRAPFFPALPLQMTVGFRFDEGVFGQRQFAPQYMSASVEQGADSAHLRIGGEAGAALAQHFEQQSQTLLLSDAPQVAKVYGAWLYLDRGRAWGLKMNDRLVVKGQEGAIKGHVVGFYGPGLALKSPRGFGIDEGAIVFVRKGQKLAQVGQLLDFDETQYPTPWPPAGAAAKK